MVEQRCVILEPDPSFDDVVFVRVPSIYPLNAPLTDKLALPKSMARLYTPAALALAEAFEALAAAGGYMFISDMFRSSQAQAKSHSDYLSGRKSAYSPPPGGSMHEAGRAIDIDPGNTGVGLKKTKQILAMHGWIGIAATGSECWHHDWRGPDGQEAFERGGVGMSRYRAMARHCIAAIRNTDFTTDRKTGEDRVIQIQRALNKLIEKKQFTWPRYLITDGIYGPETKSAVTAYQKSAGLVPDGIVGPITEKALRGARSE